MARHALLNNVDHKAMRVITSRSAAFGDAVMHAVTFPAEFRNIQACYPIVFQKRADTGQFQSLALFGFEVGENLFLTDSDWEATYIPFSIERLPFLIGAPRGPASGADPQLMIHVDLDSPRISSVEGEALFRDYGGTTEYLDRMSSMLRALHEGLEATPRFVDALLKLDLLESFVLDVALKDGSQNRLTGFYTVNEDRLRALDAAAIGALHADGLLEPLYMVVASTVHFRDLIDARNRRSR
jgi:SapC